MIIFWLKSRAPFNLHQ